MSEPASEVANPPAAHHAAERWLPWAVAATLFLYWWAQVAGTPYSLINDGENFWRAEGVARALDRGDVPDALAYLFERHHPFHAALGRCRPVLWAAVTGVAWTSRVWPAFYAMSGPLAFALASVVTFRAARAASRSAGGALVAQLLFALPTMAGGAWRRAGQHEPILVLLGAGAILVALRPPSASAWRERARLPAAMALLALFFFTKEASLHVIPALFTAWLVFSRPPRAPVEASRLRALAVAGLLFAFAWLAVYALVVGSPGEGTYSRGYRVQADILSANAIHMNEWWWRDLLWLPLLVLPAAVYRVANGFRHGFDDGRRWEAVCLVGLTSYLAVYLPWSSLVERKMVGALFYFALLAGIELTECARAFRSSGRLAVRVVSGAGLATAAIVVLAGIVDWPLAAHRDAVWRRERIGAEQALVREIVERVPRGGTVAFDVEPGLEEYASGTALHLRLWHDRPDVRIVVLSLDRPPETASLVVAYQGETSAAGRALSAGDPVVVGRSEQEQRLWSVWHVLRSLAFTALHGRWPGVPIAAPKDHSWTVTPGRELADPKR